MDRPISYFLHLKLHHVFCWRKKFSSERKPLFSNKKECAGSVHQKLKRSTLLLTISNGQLCFMLNFYAGSEQVVTKRVVLGWKSFNIFSAILHGKGTLGILKDAFKSYVLDLS